MNVPEQPQPQHRIRKATFGSKAPRRFGAVAVAFLVVLGVLGLPRPAAAQPPGPGNPLQEPCEFDNVGPCLVVDTYKWDPPEGSSWRNTVPVSTAEAEEFSRLWTAMFLDHVDDPDLQRSARAAGFTISVDSDKPSASGSGRV